ncbi:desulforedoxin [SAR202 cluster bacterium AD-804-J14_MRT_500m]|nr:desulforedoxin [SAR202 cluster bacterium AD-804-J14_MRT_500m]
MFSTPIRLLILANQTGKRYLCSNCGSELLVTRGGEGALKCCGKIMNVKT